MASFSADNQSPNQYEQIIDHRDVVAIQLTAGDVIDLKQGTYSEREIHIPDSLGERGGRGSKIEMFRATCPDGRVVVGKTQSIIAMWMSYTD